MKTIGNILLSFLLLGIGTRAYAQASDTICVSNVAKVYRVMPTPGSTYYWSISCGKIISPNIYADSIVVEWCNTPGAHTVQVVERDKAGCLGDTVSASVVIDPKMQLSVTGPAESCVGQPVWLNATGAASYKWNTGETSSGIYAQLQDTVTMFQVVGKDACETDTASWRIDVRPRPTASFTYSPKNPIVDETVQLHYTGQGASAWTWYLGDNPPLDGTDTNPQTSFAEKGNENLTLVARNEYGCTDTLTNVVNIGYDSKIFVPNSFTPDGNGINDSFKAVGYNLKSIHTMIFNKWGEKIFESYGVNDAWDGTYRGQRVAKGVYIYMIDAVATDGRHTYLHGNLTVMY